MNYNIVVDSMERSWSNTKADKFSMMDNFVVMVEKTIVEGNFDLYIVFGSNNSVQSMVAPYYSSASSRFQCKGRKKILK